MKVVNVYEVSQQQRVIETTFDRIPMHECNGRTWGNPDGGDRFIRYDAPVTESVERWEEDGFFHEKRTYVAVGPRLLALLAPAVNKDLDDKAAALKQRVVTLEHEAKARVAAWNDINKRWEMERELRSRLEDICIELRDRERNFLKANVISRVWRAIVGRL